MSGARISKDDIFEPGLFTEGLAGFEKFVQLVKETKEGIDNLTLSERNLLNVMKFDGSKEIDKLNKSIKDSNVLMAQGGKLAAEQAKAEISLLKVQQEKEKLSQQQIKTAKANNQETERAAKAEAKRAKEINNAQSAYNKLSQELIKNKKAVKDLLASGKELTDADRHLIKETQELDKKLKEIDSQVGDNQRNVGGYKEALNDAAAELGAFGGGLSRIIRTLKILQKENSETTSRTQKLGNALKIIGAGLVLAVVALAAKAFEAFKDASLAASDAMEILNAKINAGLVAQGRWAASTGDSTMAMELYVLALQKSRIELRSLSLQLQRATLDEEHYQQIANDTTIGFDERNKALRESIKFGDQRAEIAIKQAKLELDIANRAIIASEVAVGVGNANNELKDKQLEATLKYNEAVQAQTNLELTDGEKVRQMNQAKAEEEIKLLVSKKEAAHEQQAILQQQLKDERFQLEQRKKIASDLLATQKRTTNEELALFKKDIGIRFKNADLLQEKDEIALANKLKNLKTLEGKGLGADAIALLAKIVKQSQENEIANDVTLAALQNEEIKRQQKLFQIRAEISDLQNQEDIKIKEREINTLQKLKEDEIRPLRQFKLESLQEKKLTELKRKALIEKEKNDEIIANNTINDTQELNAEIEKLQKKLNNDLLENDLDHIDKEKAIEEAKKEYLRKQLKEEADTIVDFAEQAAKRKNDVQKEQLDNDLEMRQRNILQQQQLAEQGYNNTLAFEKAAAAKDELAKQQLAIKQEKQAKALAFLKLLAGYADKDADTALAKTLIEMAIAGAITGSYKEGVEGLDGAGTETSDSILARLSKNESVITAKGTKADPGLATAMNKGKVSEYFEQEYLPKYMTETGLNTGSLAQNMTNSLLLREVTTLNKEITEIKQVLKDRPTNSVNLNNLGEVVDTKIVNGLKKQTIHKRNSPLNYI